MLYLPLYRDADTAVAVDVVHGRPTEPGRCTRCELHRRALSKCIDPELRAFGDDPRTIMFVGEAPGRREDKMNQPFVGPSGRLLRDEVEKHWKGQVVFDNGLKCYVGPKKKTKTQSDKWISACRPYLVDTIAEAKPDRIIALGSAGIQALLGRTVPPYSVRRGFSFLQDGTPVYLGINPAAALRNRFVKRWFKSDLKWALTTENPMPTHWDSELTVVRTRDQALEAVDEFRSTDWFAYDTETSGVFGDDYFRVLCVAACAKGSDFPWVWDEQALHDPELAEPLFEAMEDRRVGKVGHNVKHDMLAMRFGHDIVVQGIAFDTMNDRRLLNASVDSDLETVAELVGMGGHKSEAKRALAEASIAISKARERHRRAARDGVGLLSLPGMEDPAIEAACRLIDLSPKTFAYALLPWHILIRYCALDAVSTTRIGELQVPKIPVRKVEKVRATITTPAVEAYEQVEAWGFAASSKAIQAFNEYLTAKLEKTRTTLERFHDGFDPNSRDMVEHVLYDVLGAKSRDREKTESGKRGTNKDVLRRLVTTKGRVGRFVQALQEYRRLVKLLGTYAEGFAPHVRADGRIHPNIKITGTETGRPSCENPNLQNLPRAKTPEGIMARDCFVAPKGKVLLEADYSQIEIRVGAMLSGDEAMIECFRRGEDLHWKTTKIISRDAWGLDPSVLDREKHDKERTESKVTTFGLMYGKTDIGLAEDLGISVEKAGILRKSVLGGYPTFAAWCEEQIIEGKRTGETWTWWNGERFRVRPIWQIGDSLDRGKPTRRAVTAANSTINTPIQGTASDYCVRSLIAVVAACLRGDIPAKVVITIHDAIMLECDEDKADEVARKVGAIMLSWPTWNGVPLAVDFKKGRTWGGLKSFEPELLAA